MRRLIPLISAVLSLTAALGSAQMRKIPAELTPLSATDAVHAGTEAQAAVSVKLPQGFHMQSNAPRNPLLVATALAVEAPPGVEVLEVVYPAAIEFRQEDVELPLVVFETEYAIGLRLKMGAGLPPGEMTVPVRLKYQPCDETMCYPPNGATATLTLRVVPADTPLAAQHAAVFGKFRFGSGQAPVHPVPAPAPAAEVAPLVPATGQAGALASLDRFAVTGTAGGYMRSADFLAFVHNSEAGVKEDGMFDGRGPLAIILLVMLGGFMLNLTPCVLPMIPINLAIIGAGAQAGSARRGMLLGATYGAAMALVYGLIGLVVILTAGTFGSINSSPWFNIGIAVLFVVLGLAMFDVVSIDLSRWSSGFNPKARRGSFVLAFSMGGVAALLAGACVAPVVIQVVLYASSLYAGGTRIALALPFFLGLGMALPWPFAGAGLSALPKPGMWMVRVKQAFGVLIIGMALYYGFLAYEILSNRHAAGAPVAAAGSDAAKEDWLPNLAEGLALAERERKPVIIDFWASWCKNCMTMDQSTFKDEKVKAALAGYVKIKVQAEDAEDEFTKTLMRRFKAVGLPTYVILKPGAPGL
jgi:thiol:disulfide interchange protein DsbD